MGSGIINEQVALAPIAQAESTRSYLLAQTLESTRTVPVVSAKLPVDSEETDEVLGSFTYRGITYAVEPGGESVAIVAADFSKLPQDFLEAQTIVLPSVVSFDGIDSYSVTRIANGAFSSLTKAAASASVGGEEAGAHSDTQLSDASDGGDVPLDAPGEGADLASAADEEPAFGFAIEGSPSAGITAITIPASVTSIEDDAFAGFDTLQYVIVSDDNPNYSMYDGCLYDEPLESLLLIPGGRLGAVRVAPSATSIPEKAYSHCAHLEALVADPASAASQLLEGSVLHNAFGCDIDIVIAEDAELRGMLHIVYAGSSTIEIEEVTSAADMFETSEFSDSSIRFASSCDLEGLSRTGSRSIGGQSIELARIQFADNATTSYEVRSTYIEDEEMIPSAETSYLGESSIMSAAASEDADDNGAHSLSFTNGRLNLTLSGASSWWFLSTTNGADGVVSWTGGSEDAPATGSIVTVRVTRYDSNRPEGSRDVLLGSALNDSFGDESNELVGIRNIDTGSYTSIDAIFSGGEFTFSFVMPASGCAISSSGFSWTNSTTSTFVPVYSERRSSIYNFYRLKAGENTTVNTGYGWKNPITGVTTFQPYAAAVYSSVGNAVQTPTHSIPVRTGYTFLGWYTDPEGGDLVSDTARADDNGRTYYAHWGATGGSLSFTDGKLALMLKGAVSWWFLSASSGADGTISWTGGSESAPAAGSVVTVNVSRYETAKPEGSRDVLMGSALLDSFADENRELIGIRNTDTGSYTSVDSVFSGGEFSFSFVMPTSSCSISTNGLVWINAANSTFVPVFSEKQGAIYNYFRLKEGQNTTANTGYGWTNPVTGITSFQPYAAGVYSSVGSAVQTPTHSIPFRTGYTFLGWYTEPEGGTLIPDIARAEDNGKTYYAHWAETSGSLSFTNGSVCLILSKAVGWYFLSAKSGADGEISWTGGDSTKPAPGSVVTVLVTRFAGPQPEGSRDVLVGSTLLNSFSDENRELIGIRNLDTGSYLSMDAVFSGGTFTFSFVMPEKNCTISSRGFVWVDAASSTFVPVFAEKHDAIYNYFRLKAGANSSVNTGYGWTNPITGVTSFEPYAAGVYSTIGGAVQAPTHSIPTRVGYTFLGWYTEPEGGDVIPDIALAEDNGRTYYAHWGNKDSKFYYLKLNGNGATSSQTISRTNPTDYGFTLSSALYLRPGYTMVSWNTAANGSGVRYEMDKGYPALAEGATITVYAQWEIDRYDISYDLAGGVKASGGSYPESYTYEEGVLSVSDPVRPGYVFRGWTGTGLEGPTIALSIDKGSNDKLGNHEAGTSLYMRSYTASWEPYTYRIELYDSDTDIKIGEQTGFVYGTTKAIDPSGFSSLKPGYHVSGWTSSDGTTVDGASALLSTPSPAPVRFDDVVRLRCIWSGNPYSVRFFDGTTKVSEQTGFVYGTSKALSSQAELFAREDLTLIGWAFAYADGGQGMNAEPKALDLDAELSSFPGYEPAAENGTLDLYAVWAPIISAEVPLTVSIAFDPDRYDQPSAFKMGKGRFTTTGGLVLKVDSVALERTESSSDGSVFGTAAIFDEDGMDRSGLVELTMRGDGGVVSAGPLSLNLGSNGVVDNAGGHGLDRFSRDNALEVDYGLEFLPGCPDPSVFSALSDPAFKDSYEEDGSRKSYALAQLRYTIALAASTNE